MERDDRLGREMTRFLRDWSRRDFLRRTGQAGAVLAAGSGLAAFIEACGTGGSSGNSASSTVNTSGLPAVPSVPSDVATVAKKYTGKTVVVGANPSGLGGQINKLAAAQFEKDTGVKISFVVEPSSTSDLYAQYQRVFTSKGSTPDVMNVDVVYTGAFGQYLTDLKTVPLLPDQASKDYPALVQNDTVNGRLVGIPNAGDTGYLWYRTDLLQKYGFANPPTTWQELTDQATKIQAGEKASDPNFYGYVFQGNAYEGLTCNFMEWITSYGGGNVIDNGKVTVDNPNTIAILKLAQSWVGKISPTGVTAFAEEDSRNAFGSGQAAFMRNWPYVYSLFADPKNSKVVGKFGFAPLPHGPNGQASGAVGGWQYAINAESQNKNAAAGFIAYMTSDAFQKYRAINSTTPPPNDTTAKDPDVLKADPWIAVQTNRVVRPSKLGTKYNQGSTAIFQAVNSALRGGDVTQAVSGMKQQLQSLIG
ncbi:MAG: ABC transporter substrate-binding protein [Candidatus Nephthysia bennettiae]|nr:MAG: ABC transporter substrate-binding protein [Candidatus Dormibacteraeota bacterium]